MGVYFHALILIKDHDRFMYVLKHSGIVIKQSPTWTQRQKTTQRETIQKHVKRFAFIVASSVSDTNRMNMSLGLCVHLRAPL